MRFELVRCGIQSVGHLTPSVGTWRVMRTGHDHILAAKNEVEVAGVLKFVAAEIGAVVVGGKTADF